MYKGQPVGNTIYKRSKKTKEVYSMQMQEIRRGDIYLANLHNNDSVGSEQTLVRPVLITQNNMGNRYSPTCTVIPLSSILKKKHMPTHVLLCNTKCLERLSIALAEQITTISKDRLIKFIGKIDPRDMSNVNHAIMVQNGLVDLYNKEVM